MAADPLSSRSPGAPIVAILDLRALERLLQRSGYRRIEPSRLGDRAADISLWEGRNLFVILMPQRLVLGSIGAQDWRLRVSLDRVDPVLLRFIRADSPDPPPAVDDVPDSGTWPTR
jgi:hypothetical protein